MYYDMEATERSATDVTLKDLELYHKEVYYSVLEKLSKIKGIERKLNAKLKECREVYGDNFNDIIEPDRELLESICIIQELKDELDFSIKVYQHYLDRAQGERGIKNFDIEIVNYYLDM